MHLCFGKVFGNIFEQRSLSLFPREQSVFFVEIHLVEWSEKTLKLHEFIPSHFVFKISSKSIVHWSESSEIPKIINERNKKNF